MHHDYLAWDEQTITDFSEDAVNAMYDRGFVFTRRGKGVMLQTRSLRIDLATFKLSSENRRILRKTEGLTLKPCPLPYTAYSWEIGKMAKDFYEEKFGKGTFSANKVKELLTDIEKSSFNTLLTYTIEKEEGKSEQLTAKSLGYAICFENESILHYSYPFYDIRDSSFDIRNFGMGMMLRAIQYAKESGKRYIYLGSFQRPSDTYKLQFTGLEWFDGDGWSHNLEQLKQVNT